MNDAYTLRKSGGKRDAYELFRRMLKSGNPPNDWNVLIKSVKSLPEKIEDVVKTAKE